MHPRPGREASRTPARARGAQARSRRVGRSVLAATAQGHPAQPRNSPSRSPSAAARPGRRPPSARPGRRPGYPGTARPGYPPDGAACARTAPRTGRRRREAEQPVPAPGTGRAWPVDLTPGPGRACIDHTARTAAAADRTPSRLPAAREGAGRGRRAR